MSENTDMKFMEEFRKLVDRAEGDPKWDSTNPLLKTNQLRAQYDAAMAAVEDIPVKLHPHKIDINDRQDAYATVKPLTRKSRGILRSSGATANEVDDGMTLIRKILGQRAAPKPKDDPTTPENEAENAHSASQLSYASQEGNIRSYGIYLGNVAKYTPNETDVTAQSFIDLADSLGTLNESVSTSFIPWKDSLGVRDALLYDNPDSIYEVAKLAKEYYKGIHDGNPAQYRQITSLKFVKPKRRK